MNLARDIGFVISKVNGDIEKLPRARPSDDAKQSKTKSQYEQHGGVTADTAFLEHTDKWRQRKAQNHRQRDRDEDLTAEIQHRDRQGERDESRRWGSGC